MQISGYIARETEKAIAFLADAATQKPLWIPRSKLHNLQETDEQSPRVRLAGEKIDRAALPVTFEIEDAFLAKVAPHMLETA